MKTTKTPTQRSVAVAGAVTALQDATSAAIDALTRYGAEDERTLAAWETVEQHGATVHRQARLLAGKSRGG